MTPGQIAIVVALFIVLDVVVIGGIAFGMVHFLWRPLLERFPPIEPAEDAVRRPYQSFNINLLNLGWSVHVTADEAALHLEPVRPLRAIGFRPLSIPWDDIEYVRPRGARGAEVRVGRETIRGPSWCLDLARPEAATEAD